MDMLEVVVVTAMLVNSAGDDAEGTTRRIVGTGDRAGRMIRGLPNEGRESDSDGVVGRVNVGCTI